MFVFETVFISEKIAEYRFRAFLETSNKFVTKMSNHCHIECHIILSLRLKTVWKVS